MTNDELKVYTNISYALQKVEIKDLYTEEDYSNIYNITEGYISLEKFINNKETIDELLNKEIEGFKLKDLLRRVRNRYCHPTKINAIKELIVLQTKADRKDIHKLISELKAGIEYIYENVLDYDYHKVIMNSKPMINIFEVMKDIANTQKPKTELESKTIEKLKPLLNDFKYDESTPDDFTEFVNGYLETIKSDVIKEGLIEKYGIDNYNELIKMISKDDYTEEQVKHLLEEVTKIDPNKNE